MEMATNWKEKKFEALANASIEANRRSRGIFGVINIIGFILLSAQFNAYLPWIRHALPEDPKQILKFLLGEFHQVAIPIFGVKFDVWDLQTMGSISLFVLAVWFFFCARRENHIVMAFPWRKNESEVQPEELPVEERALIAFLYYNACQYSVFNTATSADLNPIAELAREILLFIPAWVPVVLLCADILSLFLPHILSTPTPHNEALLCNFVSHPGQLLEIGIRSVICILMAWMSKNLCSQIKKFYDDREAQLKYLREIGDFDDKK